MGGTRGTAAGFSGGSGGAGGYRYQALAAAYVAAHALASRPLNWIAPAAAGAVPLAVWSETGGPGDDLKVELRGSQEAGNGLLEVQAKRGIGMGSTHL